MTDNPFLALPDANKRTPAESIRVAAQKLGTTPQDLATVMSYETGGTFNPSQVGGAGNRYRGLIQFGPAEQQKYQPSPDFDSQVQNAVVPYLQDRGYKPGMGLLDLYSTINAGRPGLYNASDRAGYTVQRHVQEMAPHRAKAAAFLGEQFQPQSGEQIVQVSPAGGTSTGAQVFTAPQGQVLDPTHAQPIPVSQEQQSGTLGNPFMSLPDVPKAATLSTDNPFAGLPDEGSPDALPPKPSVPDATFSFGQTVVDPLVRGAQGVMKAKAVTGLLMGGDPQAAAGTIAEANRLITKNTNAGDYGTAIQEVNTNPRYQGWMGKFRALREYPTAFTQSLLESTPSNAMILGGGIAGGTAGLLGGPVGAIAGAQVGSALPDLFTNYGGAMEEYLQQHGYDTSSETSLANAFANPKLMAEAQKAALIKSGAITAADTIGNVIGMRGGGAKIVGALENVFRKEAVAAPKMGIGRAIAETAATNLAIDVPAAGAGEAAGQVLSGQQLDTGAIANEMLGEAMLGGAHSGVEVAAHHLLSGGAGHAISPQAMDQFIRENSVQEPQVLSHEEAAQQGRTLYGFAENGQTVVPVSPDYAAAERAMGAGDARRGRLIAVSPEEVAPAVSFADTGASAPGTTAKGLNVAPSTGVVDTGFVFTGDSAQRQIAPKGEIPVLPKDYTLYADKGQGPAHVETTHSIDLVSLTKDKNFTVVPTIVGLAHLAQDVRVDTIAPQTLKLNSPELQQMQQTQGWRGVLMHLAQLPVSERLSLFQNKSVEVIPHFAFSSGRTLIPLQVVSSLPAQAAKSALAKHESIPLSRVAATAPARTQTNLSSRYYSANTLQRLDTSKTISQRPMNVSSAHSRTMDAVEKAYAKIAKRFGFEGKIDTVFLKNYADLRGILAQYSSDTHVTDSLQSVAEGKNWGMAIVQADGRVLLAIHAADRMTPQDLYHVAMHEMGHAISYISFSGQSGYNQAQIFAAYRRFLSAMGPDRQQRAEHFVRRRHARISEVTTFEPQLIMGSSANSNYMLSFEEWFAEQVARWAQTDRAPMGDLSRYFSALAKRILQALQAMREMFAMESMRAEPEMEAYLSSMYTGETRAVWGASVRAALDTKTLAQNQKYGVNVPLQAESVLAHRVIDAFYPKNGTGGIGNGEPPTALAELPPSGGQLKAEVDRSNALFRTWLNIRQFAAVQKGNNPALNLFVEFVEKQQLDMSRIMANVDQRLGEWRRLRHNGQAQALSGFLFDMTEMRYRTEKEVELGVRRHPTAPELAKLVKKWNLNADALAVYANVKKDFQDVVVRLTELQVAELQRIAPSMTPEALREAMTRITLSSQQLLAAPYFPMTRFGKWFVTIKEKSGAVKHVESFETKGEMLKASAIARTVYPESEGFSVNASALPQEMASYMGMPAWFLDKLAEMPDQSPAQKDWIAQLRYESSPQASFTKHLLKRSGVPGYSQEGERVYARYMLHHAKNYARIKYASQLQSQIAAVREQAKQAGDFPGRSQIADYMQSFYNEQQNPSRDIGWLRSIAANWHLGLNIKSAIVNMTQVPLMTGAHLSLRFGEFGANAAIFRAYTNSTAYRSKGSLASGQPDFQIQALNYLIKQGLISESYAARVAALSADGYLPGFFRKLPNVREKWQDVTKLLMSTYQLVEQNNRRVTALATLDLAMKQPGNKWLAGLKDLHFLQFQDLMKEGFTEAQANAMLAAKQMILDTQYDYSSVGKAPMMRGKKGTFLMFYSFTQNTVFQMMSPKNKGLMIRYMLRLGLLSGVLGMLPTELYDIWKWIGRKYFGADYDPEREMRSYMSELFGQVGTDAMLHGISRYSFGIPWLMDQMGVGFAPSFDVSRSIALNRVLPLPVTMFLNQGADFNKQVADMTEQGAGAAFGIGYAAWKALSNTDLDWGDPKRWERTMPTIMRNTAKAFRLLREGGERNRNLDVTTPYEIDDNEQVAEAIGVALGFTPTRANVGWDRQNAEYEISQQWIIQRKLLLRDLYRQQFVYKDPEGTKKIREDITRYNAKVPDLKMRITPEGIKKSFVLRLKNKQQNESGGNAGVSPAIQQQVDAIYPKVISKKKVK